MNQQDPMAMEEYLKMLQLGSDNQGLDAQMKMQLAQAEHMRTGAPEMRQAGRVVRAPGALEVLGALAKNYAADSMTKNAMQKGAQQRDNTLTQNQALLKALLGQGAASAAPQPNAASGMMMPGLPGGQANGMTMPQPKSPFAFGGE